MRLPMKNTFLLVMVLLTISCGPEATTMVGNPDNEARLQFLIRDEGAPLLIERAWIVASGLQLVEDSCEPNEKLLRSETQVFSVNQANDPSNELVLPFYKENPSFCRIGMNLTPASADQVTGGAPADLEGASIIVEAKRASDDTPLRIRLSLTNNLRVNSTFSLKNQQRIFLVLDTNSWFTGEQLEGADDMNGMIEVTESRNPALVTQMRDSLKTNATLALDENDNGILDPEELSAPLGQGGIIP